MPDKKSANVGSKLSNPLLTQIITWVVDYSVAFILIAYFQYGILYIGDSFPIFFALGAIFPILGQAREEFYFWLLGDAVAPVKRKYNLSNSDLWYLFQTTFLGMLAIWWAYHEGIYFWDPMGFNFKTFQQVFFTAYVLQVLKDIFSLAVLHKIMHEIPWLYALHKEHHTVNRNAQALMAYHIDVLDLVIENICAPMIYLLILKVMGWPVRVHLCAFVLSTYLDVMIHSINPYTVCLLNPVLDILFRCNVAHQIHHSVQTANYTFVPYHHLFPGTQQKELDDYNKVMKTQFIYAF
jgi:sterol desaturase/sphingolipid hydroxylase (fatty acid hydroxylase superfamily)